MDRIIHNGYEIPTNETNLRKLYDSKNLKKLVDEIEAWLSEQAIPAIASVVFLSNRGSTTISCGRDGSQGGNFQVALKKDNIQDRERQNFLHFFYFFISHE